MGYARWNQDRARAELARCSPASGGRAPAAHRLRGRRPLLPGPGVLADGARAGRPRLPQTSGIVQPPIHATAVLAGVPPRARPAQARHSSRAPAEARAPGTSTSTASGRAATTAWSRSGIRGSRAWTTRRSGTRRSRGSGRRRTRSPTTSASTSRWPKPAERPTDGEYDRYAYLVGLYRDGRAIVPTRSGSATPFASAPCCSTRCSSRRTRTSLRSRGSSAPIPSRSASGASRPRRSRRRAVGRESGHVRRLRRPREATRARPRRRPSRRSPRACRTPAGPQEMVDRVADSRVAVDGDGSRSRAVRRASPASSPRGTGVGRSGRCSTGFSTRGLRPLRLHAALAETFVERMLELAEPRAVSGSTTPRDRRPVREREQLRLDGGLTLDIARRCERRGKERDGGWRRGRSDTRYADSSHERRE